MMNVVRNGKTVMAIGSKGEFRKFMKVLQNRAAMKKLTAELSETVDYELKGDNHVENEAKKAHAQEQLACEC